MKNPFLKILLASLLGIILTGCASINRSAPIAGVPHPAERMRQIRTLGENANKVSQAKQQEYAQTLSKIVHEETDSLIRREAVLAIAHYPGDVTVQTLKHASSDSDRDVREAVCAAWETYGGEMAVSELIQILANESDLDIRLDAIEMLGKMKNPQAVAALAGPLSENDPALQHFTVLALQNITGEVKSGPEEWLAYCQEHAEQNSQHVAITPTSPDTSLKKQTSDL
ncbi:MAG: HEAT repeat domain-containing protein [Planctomycetia bacterium]|nr:HEAT repeat domain-containing protein [Planctomycetia bacterium]